VREGEYEFTLCAQICAARDIAVNEQLLLNYGPSFWAAFEAQKEV
jgi:hypothetical protein